MLCSGTLVAQTVVYSYDAAGNRTARQQQQPSPYSTVAVSEQSTRNDLVLTGVRVYPNPTEGPLTVSIDESYVKEKCEASIYDASGKLL
jgi:uncharacterized protein RhaS with RHS repeats